MSKSVIKSDRVTFVRESLRDLRQGGPGVSGGREGQGDGTKAAAPDLSALQGRYEERTRKVEKEAYARGHAEGLREGKAQQEKKFRHIMDTMKSLIEELKKRKEEVVRDSERDIVDLSLALASKIIHQEVRKDPSLVAGVLRDILKDLNVLDGVKVVLSPVDYLFIQENEGRILKEIKNIGNIRFETDPKMEVGGVVVDTGFSIIDARVGEQLSALREAFREDPGPGEPRR